MHRRATPDHPHDHEHSHGHARPAWRPNLWLWSLAALAIWAATGIYAVQPYEKAVVWRCGRILPELSLPGIHCGLPWGIDRVTKLKVNEQKRVGIGLSLEDRNLGRTVEPRRAECLAGDRNLIADLGRRAVRHRRCKGLSGPHGRRVGGDREPRHGRTIGGDRFPRRGRYPHARPARDPAAGARRRDERGWPMGERGPRARRADQLGDPGNGPAAARGRRGVSRRDFRPRGPPAGRQRGPRLRRRV